MQQANRTGRHHDGQLDRHETVPFDQHALRRAARHEALDSKLPVDSTLPGMTVDPSLPLILTTRRQRLTLKQPSEFDLRPGKQDRMLGRVLVGLTIATITVIIFAAAPSLDVRSWLHGGSGAGAVASPAAHGAPLGVASAPTQALNPRPNTPNTSTKAPPEMVSASALHPLDSSAQMPASRVITPRPAAKVERKPAQTTSPRAIKRTKRKARLLRSAN